MSTARTLTKGAMGHCGRLVMLVLLLAQLKAVQAGGEASVLRARGLEIVDEQSKGSEDSTQGEHRYGNS
jgi:hypothetical protein